MNTILRTTYYIIALSMASASSEAIAQSRFAGTYTVTASATIFGVTRSFPVSVQVQDDGSFVGTLQIPRLLRLVRAEGVVNSSGAFTGSILTQLGISGNFSGTVAGDTIRASGNLRGIQPSPVPFTAVGTRITDQSSAFAGSYRATGPEGQRFKKFRIFVTPYDVATIEFLDGDGSVRLSDNVNISREGSFSSVKDGVFYSVDLDRDGVVKGRYESSVFGNGRFSGDRANRSGGRNSPTGSYVATSDDPRQAFVKLSFTVMSNLAVTGRFVQRSGQEVKFNAILGFQNRIVSTAEGGVNYFITVGANGDFTAEYNSRSFGNGSFSGSLR